MKEQQTPGLTPQQQAAALHNKGLDIFRAGDRQGACAVLRQALELDASNATCFLNLAVMLKGLGSDAERIVLYRKALELMPDDPVTHRNLAAVLSDGGNFTEAELHARQSLQLTPGNIDALINLGGALAGQQRFAEAAAAYDAVLQIQPRLLPVLLSSGKAHRAKGNLDDALARFRSARALLAPLPADQHAELFTNVCQFLGEVLSASLDHQGAEQQYREALRYSPGNRELLTRLGNALFAQGKFAEAETCFSEVVKATASSSAAHIDLGIVAHTLGKYEEALEQFRLALALDPHNMAVYSNIGTSLTYSPAHRPAEVKQTYTELDRIIMQPLRDPRPHLNNRDPQRPLRVGYVSPDFRKHVVAYFALPLLEGHKPGNVEVFCYYNHRQQDEWTQRFHKAARHWADCVDMDDSELAERIRADGIDILVDLTGHTLDNRLRVFARKPAPVQVTWMGYVTTTGMSAIDYRLTHADADPPGVDVDYAEKLVRLPDTMWCFRPLSDMREIAPPPFRRKGCITFGSFNRFSKISPRVLDCWAIILAAVPDSRLVMCIPEGKIREEVSSRFVAQGIGPERLSYFAKVPHAEFWALHGEVDIALDPFPFNGGTTTFETLWLGVPIVSCTGGPDSFAPRFASRMGYSVLKAVGLPELAAATEEAYIETAITLAHDHVRLDVLRSDLRQRMAKSTLTDEAGFVSEVETAYRQMWRTWLENA